MGVGVKNCEGSETFPCLPQFYGCGKKQQAPQSDTKDFITPGNVVCMSFTFTLVPLSCMEVTQRWAWDDATYRGFASEVSSSEHRKHSLSKRVVGKLAPPLSQREILSFWRTNTSTLSSGERHYLSFKVVFSNGLGLG